jgi:hypothetical protein
MTKIYELIEATQPFAQNGRPIWQAFADDFASEPYLAEVIRQGRPDIAA